MRNAIFSYKCAVLVCISLFVLIALMLERPIATPVRYLVMADQRAWLVVPNAWNVLSNIPFLLVGIAGLYAVRFNDSKERFFYLVFFIGVFFVGFGSSYYHWAPSNVRLMWDRFPIGIAMMAFVSAVMAERIDLPFSRFMLWPFLLLAIFTVYYWYFTIELGREDLRLYTFVLLFFPVILIPAMLLLFKAPYTQTKYIWFALVVFIVARFCEAYDLALYNAFGHFISGHTLKHLLLALSCLFIFYYFIKRKEIC